ncbi:hypothetical protein M0638_02175 [Roseomonas sp. NAR14]|uniref:Class II flagellar assembly regulator n=1 Tax=Roseomonas acroporae TaxID=2937791 RepID=A0A9X1Y6N3_9PROT|nr:flagellar assembly protein FliX [Roseomonas acroporae]MCK8783185.1 hypothetical protein [Roseomonas acroporae]
MLPIRPLPSVTGPAAANPPAGRGGFRVGDAPARPEEAAPVTAPALPVGLLGLQEEDGARERDRRAWRRGQALLRELQAMQRELLGGLADPARPARLAALAEGEAAADPALRETLDALVLRARLEIARRGAAVLGGAPSSK